MIDANKFRRVSQKIDSYRDQAIELQKTLTAIPAVAQAAMMSMEF